jgi:hypothetical protein
MACRDGQRNEANTMLQRLTILTWPQRCFERQGSFICSSMLRNQPKLWLVLLLWLLQASDEIEAALLASSSLEKCVRTSGVSSDEPVLVVGKLLQ